MLREIETRGVGPAEHMKVPFGERLTLISGDNGLGKSFILDLAWWALTGTWADQAIVPKNHRTAEIITTLADQTQNNASKYNRMIQDWQYFNSNPKSNVIYFRSDRSVLIFDYIKRYIGKAPPSLVDQQLNYSGVTKLSDKEIFDGTIQEGVAVIEGMISDIRTWQLSDNDEYRALKRVFATLSPPNEKIEFGTPKRQDYRDARSIPTIKMSYGEETPLTLLSSGIRRMISLAYVLVWSWQEHKALAELSGDATQNQIVIIVDEIESHLHPRWQRSIIPSLLEVAKVLELYDNKESDRVSPRIQIIGSTHSPLVFSSLEPLFGLGDRWIDIDLLPPTANGSNATVDVREKPFERHRDANGWLLSEAFDLSDTGSHDAEKAIAKAAAVARKPDPTEAEIKDVEQDLARTLSETDPAWAVWRTLLARRGAAE